MSNIGYLIRFRPYILEEDANDRLYRCYFNQIDEFYTDECEFNARVTELKSDRSFEDLDGAVYDGVDIDDLYTCELRRITSR